MAAFINWRDLGGKEGCWGGSWGEILGIWGDLGETWGDLGVHLLGVLIVTLRLKTAQEPYRIWSLGPKAFKYKS